MTGGEMRVDPRRGGERGRSGGVVWVKIRRGSAWKEPSGRTSEDDEREGGSKVWRERRTNLASLSFADGSSRSAPRLNGRETLDVRPISYSALVSVSSRRQQQRGISRTKQLHGAMVRGEQHDNVASSYSSMRCRLRSCREEKSAARQAETAKKRGRRTVNAQVPGSARQSDGSSVHVLRDLDLAAKSGAVREERSV
jgi:hypothetical protein